jgi:hypothetical protein
MVTQNLSIYLNLYIRILNNLYGFFCYTISFLIEGDVKEIVWFSAIFEYSRENHTKQLYGF